MIQLNFRVETAPDGRRIKVREDGRKGPCLGDEALLWDALEEARQRCNGLAERVAAQSELLSRDAEKSPPQPVEAQAVPKPAQRSRR